jgi:hypothetical protein
LRERCDRGRCSAARTTSTTSSLTTADFLRPHRAGPGPGEVGSRVGIGASGARDGPRPGLASELREHHTPRTERLTTMLRIPHLDWAARRRPGARQPRGERRRRPPLDPRRRPRGLSVPRRLDAPRAGLVQPGRLRPGALAACRP